MRRKYGVLFLVGAVWAFLFNSLNLNAQTNDQIVSFDDDEDEDDEDTD